MSTTMLLPQIEAEPIDRDCQPRAVVAVIVEWRGRIALFKRSQSVGHDQGRWHCITGYLEPGTTPEEQALMELREETGLIENELIDFRHGVPLRLRDEWGNPWLVHTFTVISPRRRLIINDEHDAFRWVAPSKISRFSNRVAWLDRVLDAFQKRATPEPDQFTSPLEGALRG